jgi:dinuclear metal center YbgI/SA1388 family protein
MTIADIIRTLEAWAPRWTAWERDNVGLQVGDPRRSVRRVLVTLDVTPAVVEEAVRRKVELIVSHHPLLFRPTASITSSDEVGRMILALAERRITLYSAHTNLDFAPGGVSMCLAQRLGLQSVRFLVPLKDTLAKVAVFVPEGHVRRVRSAMADAGAGVIGEYASCAFAAPGQGSFRGSATTNPAVGTAGQLEEIPEVRLEMVAPRADVPGVVRAMKAVHPYEEVAYDVYPLDNPSTTAGMGAVGELAAPVTPSVFLRGIRRSLAPAALRHTVPGTRRIRTVAVCAGSGSDLLPDAIRSGADAFVTADVRYHAFHAATGSILLVDAGHWETERVVLPEIAKRIRTAAAERRAVLEVLISQKSLNPIRSTVGASVA